MCCEASQNRQLLSSTPCCGARLLAFSLAFFGAVLRRGIQEGGWNRKQKVGLRVGDEVHSDAAWKGQTILLACERERVRACVCVRYIFYLGAKMQQAYR